MVVQVGKKLLQRVQLFVIQPPREMANKQRPLLDNGSVITFTRQRIRTKQQKDVVSYVVRAEKL
jgi:hypothetical protein